MSITSNIAGMQINGGGKAAQSQAFGQGFGQSADLSSQGLFGFLEAFLQQMQGDLQSGAADNASQELGAFAEKIAALLKKNDITPEQIQGMQPQELAAKIAEILQQQNVQLPPTLQNMPVEDLSVKLAVMVQQNGTLQAGSAFALKNSQPQIKASLTSDLIAPQVTSIQDAQTKDDIAKKISAMLEQQQTDGFAAPLTPAQLQQLQTDLAQLQNASGSVDTDTMVQLLADVKSFLKAQGVDEASIKDFLAKIPQSLEQAAQAQAANASAGATQTKDQKKQESADSSTQPAETDTSLTENVTNSWQSFQPATVLKQSEKKFAPDNRPTPIMVANTDTAAYTAKQPENLTAKISGMNVNPAMINDMAGADGSGADFNSFNSQNGQPQDMMGSSPFLQPLSADALKNPNFINYLGNATGQASPTTQMISVQLRNNIGAGINTMTLQLDPADLGRMDVRLKFSKDGTVTAHMSVEKPETLALLQKDASHLHRALQQSGLTTDENSLSFDLRQQGQQQQANDFNGHGGRPSGGYGGQNDNFGSSALQAQIAIQSSGYITRSGVNIMV